MIGYVPSPDSTPARCLTCTWVGTLGAAVQHHEGVATCPACVGGVVVADLRCEDADTPLEIDTRLPEAMMASVTVSAWHSAGVPRGGIDAIAGKWPVDETDEQIDEALRRLS